MATPKHISPPPGELAFVEYPFYFEWHGSAGALIGARLACLHWFPEAPKRKSDGIGLCVTSHSDGAWNLCRKAGGVWQLTVGRTGNCEWPRLPIERRIEGAREWRARQDAPFQRFLRRALPAAR